MFSHKDEENKKKHTEKVRLEREIGHQDEEIEDLMKKIDKEDRKIDQQDSLLKKQREKTQKQERDYDKFKIDIQIAEAKIKDQKQMKENAMGSI